jgi:iron complex outermembrane receptor protein
MVSLGRLTGTVALVLLGTTGGTFAAAADAPDETVLEEITVTAQKRSESLQDVPISIATVSPAQLTELSVAGEDIRVLSGRIPNLNVESTYGRVFPRFYVRGLGNDDFTLNAQSPVEMYYDDVVLENVVLKGMPAFDLEGIQVLRGPQGTLWGKNATGGAIILTSRKPTQDTEAYASASLGNFNAVNSEAAIGGSLVEGTLAGRVSVLYEKRDGWVHNVVTGGYLDGYDDTAWRAQLSWTPGGAFTALAQVHGRSLNGNSTLFIGDPKDPANVGSPYTWCLCKNNIAIPNDHNADQQVHQQGASLRMTYDLASAVLTSLTGYETGGLSTVGEVDGSPRGQDINASYVHGLHQITEELRLASPDNAQVTWQAGLFYFDEVLHFDNTTVNDSFQDAQGNPGFGAYQSVAQNSKSYAGFAQARWPLLDRLHLTTGARYTRDKVDLFNDTAVYTPKATDIYAVPNFVTDPFYAPAQMHGPDSFYSFIPRFSSMGGSWGKATWDVSLDYTVNDQVNTYARVARGYHGGEIASFAIFSPLAQAGPETVTSYELGVKTLTSDRRLRFNAAAFYWDYRGKQTTAYHSENGQEVISLFNARGGIGYGGEWDLDYQILRSLRLSVNGGYTKTKILDTSIQDPRAPANVPTPLSLDGQPFTFAPVWTGTVSGEWTHAMPRGEGFISSAWTYRGSEVFQVQAFVQPQYSTGGYWEGSGRAGWRFDNAEIAAWIRNATNSVGRTSALNVGGYAVVFNGPRTYGIELLMRLH